ncbi:MAG TPA: hypothetical protein VIF82_14450 [Burkholderiaceae bacterium]|jgi:hypothetical protein
MTQIIAGHFQQQQQVQQAIDQLQNAGFTQDKICAFYLNPAGQHDLFPIGGDRDKSPGAKESGHTMARGAATGGVIGGAAGTAGVPIAGPVAPAVGAFVGAHVGSLIGSLSGMKESGEPESDDENTAVPRKAGMMVAVSTEQPGKEDDAVKILQSLGAEQIEKADGKIADGNWEDFDPLTPPHLIN